MEPKKKYLSKQEALLKAASYCAYQERCHQEVLAKLSEWGVYGIEADEIVVNLIQQNYLNEERFAQAFAGGKFRVKKWGRLRIKQELKLREVSDYCIQKGLKEIPDDDYRATLQEVLEKKLASLPKLSGPQARLKAYQYALSRGYEPALIWEILDELKSWTFLSLPCLSLYT